MKRSNAELLEWVGLIILAEQIAETYGTIQIQLEKGTITTCRVEQVKKPMDAPSKRVDILTR